MTALSTRPAKIGNVIKVEKASASKQHQGEMLSALVIPLTDIMLDERELNALLANPTAHDALFSQSGSMIEPNFTKLKPLALDEKFSSAVVSITHGVSAEKIRLAPVRLSKIKLAPQVGGLTAMTCSVTCTPDLDAGTAHLLARLDSSIDVEIDFGATKDDQEELPLNNFGEGEESSTPKRRGRPPRAASQTVQ